MAVTNTDKDHDTLMIEAMTTYMTECMSGHDPSHNPAHVHRVVGLAQQILKGEQAVHPETPYDQTVVTLAAILHDIGDRKYLPATVTAGSVDPKRMVHDVLAARGMDPRLAERVQTIVSNVSYSNEIKDPARVRSLIDQEGYVELAIVQDADRLDAIGAVGIARTFTYLGAQGPKIKPGERWEMDQSIEHFGDKLETLEGMMKTETGRAMARERTRRLVEFRTWWEDETGPLFPSDLDKLTTEDYI
jgi:HD superfamily phosphodiesterase